MNCEQTRQFSTQTEQLSDAQRDDYETHLQGCAACQAYIAADDMITTTLQNMPEQIAPARILKNALQQITVQQKFARLKVVNIGVGLAFAASLMIAIVLPGIFGPLTEPEQDVLSTITMSMNTPRMVNIQFDSPEQVDDAVIIVSLPQNIRIAGYENNSKLRWTTTLKAGKNSLKLPLVASTTGSGILQSELKINGKTKTFALQVDVSSESAPSSAINHATV